MKSSELVVGALYYTAPNAAKDPMVVIPVDVSLTWHKNMDNQYRTDWRGKRRLLSHWQRPAPELYRVTDKSQLAKYARGGVAVLTMNAVLFFKTGGTGQPWTPDVLSPKQFGGPWADLRTKLVDEDREYKAKIRLEHLEQENSKIKREKEQATKLAEYKHFNGLLEQLVDREILPDALVSSSINMYSLSKGQRCQIKDDMICIPLSFAEILIQMSFKTQLFANMAGVEPEDFATMVGLELDMTTSE